MKYIIVDGKYPILFSNTLLHCEVAEGFADITSAGHTEIENGKVRVFGESETLNLKWKDGDATLISNLLNL